MGVLSWSHPGTWRAGGGAFRSDARSAHLVTVPPTPHPVRLPPSSAPPLRVVLLGYGLGGAAFHAPVIAAVPVLRLAAIVSGNRARQEQARATWPGVRILADAGDAWRAARDFDVAVISTPNRTHAPLAIAALRAGLHVVVDKPFATSASEARSIVEEADRCGRLVTVYQNRRWDGDFMTVRDLLQSGRLGTVARFESRFERWRPTLRGGWRESGAADDAGGLLMDLGSHLIDQALVLFGPVTHIHAELDVRRAGATVDDDVFVALTHASGVRSHLYASALAAQPGPRFRVLGDRAAYVKHGTDPQEAALRAGMSPAHANRWGIEPEEQWGTLGCEDALVRVPTVPGAYHQFYAAFADAILGGGPSPVDTSDAIRVLEIIEAAQSFRR